MGRKAKYSVDVKVKACEDYINGRESFIQISNNLNCNKSVFRRWINHYKVHGSNYFDNKSKNKSYTAELKNQIIEEYLSGKGSINMLAVKYNITSDSLVLNWIKKYNNGIEITDYNPRSEAYIMKSRITTYEERITIVNWCKANNNSYKDAAANFNVPYAQVYKWVNKFNELGTDALSDKRGRPRESEININDLSEEEKLRLENKRLKELLERKEFELEVHKKKKNFENFYFLKTPTRRNLFNN